MDPDSGIRPPLLDIRDLRIEFHTPEGVVRAVNGVNLQVAPGETVGLVGESGSGKSVTAMSILRLLQEPPARLASGQILFEGENLLTASADRMRSIRGNRIAMIFQDPMTALNPVLTIGSQIAEVLSVHGKRGGLRDRVVSLLRSVRLPDADKRLDDYPHQFSGGMRQRAMIAMGLACQPALLLADEPTTALDVTIQAQIMDLLDELRATRTAILLITHNLGLVAQFCDRTAVMYAGQIVESAPTSELFARPHHPYTRGLLASLPRLSGGSERLLPIAGQPPDMSDPPGGCPFHPRCPQALDVCKTVVPGITRISDSHLTRCHLYGSPP